MKRITLNRCKAALQVASALHNAAEGLGPVHVSWMNQTAAAPPEAAQAGQAGHSTSAAAAQQQQQAPVAGGRRLLSAAAAAHAPAPAASSPAAAAAVSPEVQARGAAVLGQVVDMAAALGPVQAQLTKNFASASQQDAAAALAAGVRAFAPTPSLPVSAAALSPSAALGEPAAGPTFDSASLNQDMQDDAAAAPDQAPMATSFAQKSDAAAGPEPAQKKKKAKKHKHSAAAPQVCAGTEAFPL